MLRELSASLVGGMPFTDSSAVTEVKADARFAKKDSAVVTEVASDASTAGLGMRSAPEYVTVFLENQSAWKPKGSGFRIP